MFQQLTGTHIDKYQQFMTCEETPWRQIDSPQELANNRMCDETWVVVFVC